jgi:predicted metal-dependent peptidase
MQTIEQLALDRVLKARAELILTRRFYGVLVSNVEPVIDRKVPTAATDGKKHYWNPEFVMSLTQAELLGVQAHESEHDARHHGTRRASREPVQWNEAGDHCINPDLIAEGFVLPKGALLNTRFAGMSADEIYRTLELDKKQPEPEPEQPADEEDGEEDQPGENADTDPGNDDDTPDSDQPGDEPGEEPGDGAEGEDEEPGEGAGKGAGEAEGEGEGGEGDGTGEGGDAPGEAATGAGEGGEGEAKPSFEGNFGEVLDSAAADEHDVAEQDQHWEKVVRQAVSLAKAVGQLPGHVTREIERANNPPRDWRDELREFAEQGALKIETWNRPNRRFIGRGLVLPGSQRDGVNKAVFIIDTSGSCDDIALACVNDEAQALLDDGIVNEVVVLYGDVVVTREDSYVTGEDIEFDPKGGGGTDMQPLFEHVADVHDDATLIVCFTDLDFYKTCGDEPHCPVLFAVHGYPDRVKQLMKQTPWDARAIDVGVH